MPFSKTYSKIGGRKRASGNRALLQTFQLWVTEDHFLIEKRGNFKSLYQRLYFVDIKAIHIIPNKRRALWTALFGIIGALLFLLCALNDALVEASPLYSPLLLAAIIYARGPRCTVFMETATGRFPISSLRRIAMVRKVVPGMHAIISQAQRVAGRYQAPPASAVNEHF